MNENNPPERALVRFSACFLASTSGGNLLLTKKPFCGPAAPEGPEAGSGIPVSAPGNCSLHSRAQVDREQILGNQALVPHVVKDRGGPGGGNAGVSQPQDAIKR